MRSKLEACEYYQSMRGYYDVFLLISATKGMDLKFDGNKHLSHALHDTKQDFYCYYQTGQTKNIQYLDTFNKNLLVMDSYGRYIGTDLVLTKEELAGADNPSGAENKS